MHTKSKTPSCQDIKSLSLIRTDDSKNLKTLYDWQKIIPNAAYFVGHDTLLFGQIIAMVYEDPLTEKISTVLIARHGENQYNSLTIDARSRYFPACENLLPEYRRSNVRRSLAITGLRAYANLDVNLRNILLEKSSSLEENSFDWDETTAGDLASSMQLIVNRVPTQIGEKILDLGYLQQKFSNALMLDIVYVDSEEEIDENNKLVFLLGEQLDQLFDPLTEYSPESTEQVYKVPLEESMVPPEDINDDELTTSICEELIKVQTNFTKNLVQFLQNFVVPLRIKVLNGEVGSLTISKLNLIFPPTIDEITRINCIFLDSLKVAFPFGSYEILKACGTTIPYFYKAYMRHEAATKNFTFQLNFFFENFAEFLNDTQVDIDNFTKRKIESLIHGSLNLIKLKLILNRLMENNQWNSKIKLKSEKYYKSSINTIDAFGRDKLKPYNNRVFTPTGKLLTELASGWPVELQYGWLTRRVVSIFGGKNLITNSEYNEDIVIIFSDHILFLTIDDKEYYKKLARKKMSVSMNVDNNKNNSNDKKSKASFYNLNNASFVKVHEPSIPDILMHSLINQIPLTNLPHLKVSGWADIGDIYPSTYNEGKMIQFFVIGNGIKTNQPKGIHEIDSIKKYQINDVNKLNNGLKIIDLVNKAKILNKSSPFHLFKTRNLGLSVYSTAHEKSVYVDEKSKSPFALFLNMKINKTYLYQHNLFAGLSARFVDNENIEIYGLTKDGSTIQHKLSSTEFSTFLAEELSNLYSNFLSYKNEAMVNYLISANDKLAGYLILYINGEYTEPNHLLAEEAEEEEEEEEKEREEKDAKVAGQATDLKKTAESKITGATTVNKDANASPKRIEKRTSVMKLLISPSKKKLASKNIRNNNKNKTIKGSPMKAEHIRRKSQDSSTNRERSLTPSRPDRASASVSAAIKTKLPPPQPPSSASQLYAPMRKIPAEIQDEAENRVKIQPSNTGHQSNNDARLNQKFTKSKETLLSAFTNINESNASTVIVNKNRRDSEGATTTTALGTTAGQTPTNNNNRNNNNYSKSQLTTPMKKLHNEKGATSEPSKIPAKTPPMPSVTSPRANGSSSTPKKKTSFFDKLFRRKPKTPSPGKAIGKTSTENMHAPAQVQQKQPPASSAHSPVKCHTNSNELLTPRKETKVSRTLNKLFKSSLNMSVDVNNKKSTMSLNPQILSSSSSSSQQNDDLQQQQNQATIKQQQQQQQQSDAIISPNLKTTVSKDSISTFNTTMDDLVNSPYGTPSKPSRIRSSARGGGGGKSRFSDVSDSPTAKRSAIRASDFKIRSSISVNIGNGEGELIDNNSSTIRPVQDPQSQPRQKTGGIITVPVSPTVRRSRSIHDISPIPSTRVSMSIAVSPTRSKRGSNVLDEMFDPSSKHNSLNSNNVGDGVRLLQYRIQKQQQQQQQQEGAETVAAVDIGKENYQHIEEISKLKLAKEQKEHILLLKNHRKSNVEDGGAGASGIVASTVYANEGFGSNNGSGTASMFTAHNNTNSIKESIRNSLFVDDYEDSDDDDTKRNWVIARENSSLTNIEKVGSLLSSNHSEKMFMKSIKSSTSRNWTLTRDSSSINFSKHSFKKTESGFSIYNDFVDETVAPNWIIARDNSTLLNIPKEMNKDVIGPERSLSRSKNINLLPYQNKIRHSLNSLKLPNSENLDDDQKLYALLLSKEKFDSMNNISGHNDNNHESAELAGKAAQLSDDERRLDDDDEDDDDFDFDEDEDEHDTQHSDMEYEEEEEEEEEEEDGVRLHRHVTDDDDFITPDNIADDEFEDIRFAKITKGVAHASENDDDFGFSSDGDEEEEPDHDHNEDDDREAVHEGLISEDLIEDDESFDEPKQHGLMSTLPTLSSFGEAQKISNTEDYPYPQFPTTSHSFRNGFGGGIGDNGDEYLRNIIDEEESEASEVFKEEEEEDFDETEHRDSRQGHRYQHHSDHGDQENYKVYDRDVVDREGEYTKRSGFKRSYSDVANDTFMT